MILVWPSLTQCATQCNSLCRYDPGQVPLVCMYFLHSTVLSTPHWVHVLSLVQCTEYTTLSTLSSPLYWIHHSLYCTVLNTPFSLLDCTKYTTLSTCTVSSPMYWIHHTEYMYCTVLSTPLSLLHCTEYTTLSVLSIWGHFFLPPESSLLFVDIKVRRSILYTEVHPLHWGMELFVQ